MLASCGTDLKFHNASTYDLIHVYRPTDSSGQIRTVSWCKDGSWLIVVPSKSCAEIVRTKDDIRLLQTVLGVDEPTTAEFQKTTKRNVAMSTANGAVLVYDIKGKNIKKRFVSTGTAVTTLDWSLKDTHLAIGCDDGEVIIYSNTTNQKSSVLSIPESKSVSVLKYHTNLKPILGTASDEGVVVVWDINISRKKMFLKPHRAPVTDLVFSAQNDKLLVSVALDRTFQCYDINAGVVALSVMTDHPLSSVDMAPDNISLAIASSRGMIYIYDLRKHDKPLKSFQAHSGEIKKLSYQPFEIDSTANSLQIAEDKPVEAKSQNNSEFFFSNIFVTESSKFEPKEAFTTDSAAGDSFMKGLEAFDLGRLTDSFIEKKSELSNLKLSDNVKKWMDSKENVEQQENIKRVSDISIIVTNSTPKQAIKDKLTLLKNETPNVSPIVSAPAPTISVEELSKIITESVKEAISEQFLDLNDDLRNIYWDTKVAISKLYVDLNSNMEKYFECSNSNHSAKLQQLQRENEFLRNEINELFRKNHS